MLAKVNSGACVGIQALPVAIEVDIASHGLPSFFIVGLGDRSIEESKERVRSALRNSQLDLPAKRITINLAPADLPKEGPLYDLGIAVGILIASGTLIHTISKTLFLGELSLDGSLRPVTGVLSQALLAKRMGWTELIVPLENLVEASSVEGLNVYGLKNLGEVMAYLKGEYQPQPAPKVEWDLEDIPSSEFDFSFIKGQEQAKRALEIAAAGAHNILLKGPPGAGKTLLARSFSTILPTLSMTEALEVTQIYSVSGVLHGTQSLMRTRPFRSPHHTASYVGIIGGGTSIKPGEVSLAHRGVLFLDEFPEFPRSVLESLRQPLEDKRVVISRASGTVIFPAQFILLAAQNPCPCGYLGSNKKMCICMPGQVARYQKKISGPLLDRIDIHLDVPPVEVDKLTNEKSISEHSSAIRERVSKARQIQQQRFKGTTILTNSEMNTAQIQEFCVISEDALNLLKLAISQLNLSARSYHRVLKLSRTVADLAQSEYIQTAHVAESLQYRMKEDGS